jgi:phage/plasmid-associated DNA primase
MNMALTKEDLEKNLAEIEALGRTLHSFATGAGFGEDEAIYLRLLTPKGFDPKNPEHRAAFPKLCYEKAGRWLASSKKLVLRGQELFLVKANGEEKSVSTSPVAYLRSQNQMGFAPYIVVNPGGANKSSITGSRVIFWESDPPKTKEEQLVQFQQHSAKWGGGMAVETKNSIHGYIRLDEPISADQIQETQERLILLMDSDPSIKDPNRLMRLPGFDHLKVVDDEAGKPKLEHFPVKLIHPWDGTFASRDAILAELPQLPEEVKKEVRAQQERRIGSAKCEAESPKEVKDSDVLEALACIPQRTSGTYTKFRDITWALKAHFGETEAVRLMEAHSPSGLCGWNIEQVAQSGGDHISIYTLFYYAKQHGYTFPGKRKKPTQKALKAQAKKEARAKVTDDDGIELQERFGKIAIPEIVHSQMELVTGNPTEDWICVNGKLHRWTGTHYEYVKDGIVERSILDFLRKLYIWGFADDGGEFPIPIKEYPYATARISRDCLATLKAARFLPIESIPRAGINLANGTILLSYEDGKPEFTLHPHSRDRYYLQCSPVAYDPEADTSSADTLLSAVSDTQLETFLKHQSFFFDFPGVLKLIGRPRAGICEGTGSNGKDAIRTCLEHLIGKIGSFSFEDFKAYDEGRRFNLSSLPEYQFSWSGENSHRVKLENLKSLMAAIVGNTPLVSELKGQDGQTYTPQLPLWFSLNDAPITDGAASFIKSRIAIYNFAKTYTDTPTEPNQIKADPRYAYDEDFRVKQVCPGLLVRLMEAYKRLWANGMDWKPCEGQLAEWAKTGNHLLQFGEAIGLRKQAGGNVSITALYAQLKQWYQDNDYLEIHDGRSRWLDDSRFDALVKRDRDLFARLKALYPGIETKRDTDGRITGSKGRAYIKGLAIIPTVEAEPLPEPTTVAAAPPGPCLPAELNPDAIAQAIIEAPDGDTQRYLWYDCYIPPSIRKSSWVAIVEHPLGKTAQAEILKRNEAD